jgi:hypothetical protein
MLPWRQHSAHSSSMNCSQTTCVQYTHTHTPHTAGACLCWRYVALSGCTAAQRLGCCQVLDAPPWLALMLPLLAMEGFTLFTQHCLVPSGIMPTSTQLPPTSQPHSPQRFHSHTSPMSWHAASNCAIHHVTVNPPWSHPELISRSHH